LPFSDAPEHLPGDKSHAGTAQTSIQPARLITHSRPVQKQGPLGPLRSARIQLLVRKVGPVVRL
jgi:hypothetical protein